MTSAPMWVRNEEAIRRTSAEIRASLRTSANLRELRREWHSVETTARIGLKIGTTIGGSGTKLAFELQGDPWTGGGATTKVCVGAQLGQIKNT
jgi:hypothetical protein